MDNCTIYCIGLSASLCPAVWVVGRAPQEVTHLQIFAWKYLALSPGFLSERAVILDGIDLPIHGFCSKKIPFLQVKQASTPARRSQDPRCFENFCLAIAVIFSRNLAAAELLTNQLEFWFGSRCRDCGDRNSGGRGHCGRCPGAQSALCCQHPDVALAGCNCHRMLSSIGDRGR